MRPAVRWRTRCATPVSPGNRGVSTVESGSTAARGTLAGAGKHLPDGGGLAELREAARSCRGCELYRDATQTVFGSGHPRASALFIGEQPGDEEDRAGEPFVGPAGRVFDRALADAGIDRADVYITNAVKHFKYVRPERGKRRIHQKPSRSEVTACRPWLLAELETVVPRVVVCLGATAAQSLLGPSFRVSRQRGALLEVPEDVPLRDARVLATLHPSAVLRAPDRQRVYEGLLADLRVAAEALEG